MAESALIFEEECLAHDNGSPLADPRARAWLDVAPAENAARLARAHRLLVDSGVASELAEVAARRAHPDELLSVHSPEHVDRVLAACAGEEATEVGLAAMAGPGSLEAALRSAGGALSGVEWMLEEPGRRAYVLTRPPGHHASRDEAMGFCLFNNAALAARRARELGVERVAILDWDVHHGNGTEDVFVEDPSVLFVSIHQRDHFPAGRGRTEDRGEGDGRGATVNVPLPAGSGNETYLRAVREVALPAISAFGAELVLISAGQDASAWDPLGRMSVTTEGFRAMTDAVVGFAETACEGRLLCVQEGGYNVDHTAFCVLATVESMAGLEPTFAIDPLPADVPSAPRPEEAAAIEEAREALGINV